jgi:hypothetical protein
MQKKIKVLKNIHCEINAILSMFDTTLMNFIVILLSNSAFMLPSLLS